MISDSEFAGTVDNDRDAAIVALKKLILGVLKDNEITGANQGATKDVYSSDELAELIADGIIP